MPETPSSIAARTDLPARVRELLTEQLNVLGAQLEPLLHGSLLAFRHQLAKRSELRPRSGAEEHAALTAMQNAKQLDTGIMQVLQWTFAPKLAAFDRAMAASARTPSPAGGLSLIDDSEFEESVLLDDIATRAEVRAARQLFELGYRYGALAAHSPFEAEELVLGPRTLLRSLGEIAREAGLSREHRMAWYRLLDAPFLNAADDAYAALNQHLIAQGIFSSLRPYLPRRGNAPRTRHGPPRPAGPGEPGGTAQSSDEALKPLRGLLARRRELLKLGNGPADARPASPETVQSALAALQQRALAAAPPDARGIKNSMQSLHQDLLMELRRFAPDAKGLRLADEQLDVLDLVSLWFERLLDQTRDGGAAQRLLWRLQVPWLRIALDDPGTFQRGTHPARRLLNAVAETADLWIDSSDGEPDDAVLEKLRHTVEYTLTSFNGDPATLEQQAAELEDYVGALRRRAEVAERRQRDAAQGREKLEFGRAQAAAAIGNLTAGRKLGGLMRALLEQPWTDALALAILRHGEGSEAFTRTLEVAVELVREPGERDEARLLGDLEQGLLEVGLHADEASQLAHRVLDREAPGDAEQATQTELLVKLKSRQRLGEQAGDASAAPPLGEEEQPHLNRLRALPFNTWFESTTDQGRRVRRELIWYGESGRCVLVNARGAAAGERTLEQLARQMAAGRARLLPHQDASIIDHAWHLAIASLRQFGKAEVERT